jgi:hypothetical protein
MRRFVLTYGLIAGAVLSVMMLLTLPFIERIGFDQSAVIGYTAMVLAFLMVWFGVASYREHAGGHLSFGRAFQAGLLITLVASACYVATWQVVHRYVAPDFMDKYAAHVIDDARRAGATEAEIAARRQQMDDFARLYRNPLVNIGITFLEPLPVGLVFTLVTAALQSRRRSRGAATAG